ncbi:MAG: hypothetical protein JW751_22715 [Polyangiaceae bacterium]|nr:hypothetical protein [Polyangiaceae bacterium]
MRVSFAVLFSLWLLAGMGCGADHAAAIDQQDGRGEGGAGGAGGDGGLEPLTAPPDDCSTGDRHECRIYIEQGGVTNCFTGVNVCIEDAWWEVNGQVLCMEEDQAHELLVELGFSDEEGAGGANPGG